VFEAAHSERSSADPEDVWGLWRDPARWPDWNEQVEQAEFDGELRVGAEARVKLRRGGRIRYTVVELEPDRRLVTEASFPGATVGHEHRLDPGRSSVEITHRLLVTGPLAGFWAMMLGRKRMRTNVVRFVERERELTEPRARQRAGKRRPT
jgi:hypothetical protein